MTDKTSVAKRMLKRIGRHRPLLVLSLVMAAINVAMSLAIPVLVGKAIDHIVDAGRVEFQALKGYLLLVGVCAGVSALAQWLMGRLNDTVTYRVCQDIRNDAFAHIQKLPLIYLDRKPHGDLVSRVIADVDQFSDGLIMGFTQLFTGIITIFGTLIFMFKENVGIT